MYTNTPLDNHFAGTEPFIKTDPTSKRSLLQRTVIPYLHPVVLCFGLLANYTSHLSELLQGREKPNLTKLFLPLQFLLLARRWGLGLGLLLFGSQCATLGVYYFTLALMNHNSDSAADVGRRNGGECWGERQLASCAEWGCQESFLGSARYLWLNYHAVHHLFPMVDFSHHKEVQMIVLDVCRERGVKYEVGKTFWQVYLEMIDAFREPKSLFLEIAEYRGD